MVADRGPRALSFRLDGDESWLGNGLIGATMRGPYSSSSSIVVGIDGSRSAAQAALWAIDEAVSRDVPLQLVCAIDATNEGDRDDATEVAAAEQAIKNVITEIESTGKQVKIEADVVHSHPAAALLEASRSVAMICVGSTGVKHAMQGRIGSTAAALALAAHCPVAVMPTSRVPRQDGLILAAVDESPSCRAVLELAVQEARLRGAPLRVITMQRRQIGFDYDAGPAADRSHRIERQIDQPSHPLAQKLSGSRYRVGARSLQPAQLSGAAAKNGHADPTGCGGSDATGADGCSAEALRSRHAGCRRLRAADLRSPMVVMKRGNRDLSTVSWA